MKVFIGFLTGIVSGAVIALLFMYAYLPNPNLCGRCMETKAGIAVLNTAISMYIKDTERLPTQEEGLNSLKGKYLESLPKDAWDYDYHYHIFQSNDKECYVVWSLGSDGKQGGTEIHSKDFHVFNETGNCITRASN